MRGLCDRCGRLRNVKSVGTDHDGEAVWACAECAKRLKREGEETRIRIETAAANRKREGEE